MDLTRPKKVIDPEKLADTPIKKTDYLNNIVAYTPNMTTSMLNAKQTSLYLGYYHDTHKTRNVFQDIEIPNTQIGHAAKMTSLKEKKLKNKDRLNKRIMDNFYDMVYDQFIFI